MSQYYTPLTLVHLEGLYHMFQYLSKHEMSRLVFDTFQLKFVESAFALGATDWKDFYGDIKYELSPGMPDPLSKSEHMTCFLILIMMVTLLIGVCTQVFLCM